MKTTPTTWSRVKYVLLIIILGFFAAGALWATYARPPLPDALVALESNPELAVSQGDWLVFQPLQDPPTAGLIFYPGGRVDPRGYAPLLREIAAAGYLVVVPRMPINMAAFNPNAADQIITHYPEITTWTIGGHSLGGTMAAQYTGNHPDLISGLVIWASYPANSADIASLEIPVLTIYGTLDPGATENDLSNRKDLYPEGASYLAVQGGDHHQFGSYLTSPDKNYATISRDEQHKLIVQATLELLEEVDQQLIKDD